MNRCASVRKRGAYDQCLSRPLPNHTLCGRHARVKTPVLWVTVHRSRQTGIGRIQARVRGWLVRQRLRLAGPGVLRRTALANDEDLFTCESKDRQHPLSYFAFEEAGKTWWFDLESLWAWSLRSHEPVNPYTKVPLSADTRRRLRELWGYAHRNRLPLPAEAPGYEERLLHRWNGVVQTFVDNGFLDLHPRQFVRFTKTDFLSMFLLLYRDLLLVLRESDPQRDKILRYCRRAASVSAATRSPHYILQSVYVLRILLSIPKEPYPLVFSILSALYRC